MLAYALHHKHDYGDTQHIFGSMCGSNLCVQMPNVPQEIWVPGSISITSTCAQPVASPAAFGHARGAGPPHRYNWRLVFWGVKTDAPVQPRNRCESAMRGLGCGSRIGRSSSASATYFSFIGAPGPCFLAIVRRVRCQTHEGGIGAPYFLASGWVMGI